MNDNPARILIIDDEEGVRKGCCRVLQPEGYVTDTAATFREGLQKVEQGQFDLVLLDVKMPDGQGIDLLEPIHKRDPEAVSVLITGYATVETAVESMRRGAYDFISKPFSALMLLMTVERGLQKRRLSIEAKRLKTLEKQAAELVRSREEAERLYEFKSFFATKVAHELRSPVGGAQSLVRTLLHGLAGDLNQKQTEILRRVDVRLSELLALTNDLLTLAASKSLETDRPLQAVNVDKVLQRVIERVKDKLDAKNIALIFPSTDPEFMVSATEDGLDTILSNLVENACKYTLPGGTIRIGIEKHQDLIRVSVADTGIGIPADDLPHLGEEFYRAKNANHQGIPGTGLGLSIINELLKRFGGHIEIQSKEGKGTDCMIDLPVWNQD